MVVACFEGDATMTRRDYETAARREEGNMMDALLLLFGQGRNLDPLQMGATFRKTSGKKPAHVPWKTSPRRSSNATAR
ncbi:hypothetical protein NDK50_11090 [Paraburkholderia bryophila]|nr:hypothetical protein [Paraburkholderia bryophila]WCM18032.1 hypothetical protein NDK50_11090 [Paraburkholderia bryophila]